LSLVATTISTADATLNTERIDQLTGLKGKLEEKEDAYKIGFPHEVTTATHSEASIEHRRHPLS
jgi:hypothetical protein